MAKSVDSPEPSTAVTVADQQDRHDPQTRGLPNAIALPRGTAVGRYVIVGPLGEGGMGIVYVAHDPDLDRQVALKLLLPALIDGRGSSEGRNRLVREAHALAKLNHPNVVAIYDSGVYGEQVFLAMELVEGPTVKAWLTEKSRSWREILDVFLQAGRGLAAAHAASLVHRDFKPNNVLIGKGGEVKVLDFGLARRVGNWEQLEMATPTDVVAGRVLETSLTHAGVICGTPGYMAPEQLLGLGSDARSDEFSYCVALYRSLYGEKPFEKPLDPKATQNRIRQPPKGTRVPNWIRRALLRGLSIKPEDRYPTLAELLDVLSDDPAKRRRRVLAIAGITALVIAVGTGSASVVLRQRAAADPCHDPEGKLTGIWDDAVRLRVRGAFAATGASNAMATTAYVEKTLDRYRAAWIVGYQDACQASALRKQPESALNLRLECLDDQRLDLRAATELMAQLDANDLSSASGIVRSLPHPTECADARTLPIVEQPSPERRPQVASIQGQLARAKALRGAGRSREELDVLKMLPEKAHALDARLLEIKILMELSHAYYAVDRIKALELSKQVAGLAEEAHMDSTATTAAAAVAWFEAVLGSNQTEIEASLNRTRSDLRRAGTGGRAEYDAEAAEAMIASFRGHDAEAATHARASLELADRLFGDDSEESLNAASTLAFVVEPLGQYAEEMALLERVISGFDSILGPKNRRAFNSQLNLAELLFDLGRARESGEVLDQAFARLKPEDLRLTGVAEGLGLQAMLQFERGERNGSLQTLSRARDIAIQIHMFENPVLLTLHRYIAELYLRNGTPNPALDEYDKYLAHQDTAADSPAWVASLRLGGWAYLAAGKPIKALPILERALTLSAAHPFYPGWVPRLRYQIAQALVLTHGDRKRAEALGQQAHDELVKLEVRKDLLAEVDAWRENAFKSR